MQICLLGRKAEHFPQCSILLPPGPAAPDKTIWHPCLCFSCWNWVLSLLLPPPHLTFISLSAVCQGLLKKQHLVIIFNALQHKYSEGHRQHWIDPGALGQWGHSHPEFNLPNWSMEMKTGCKRQTTLCALLCHSLALRARRKPNSPWRRWLFEALHKQQR